MRLLFDADVNGTVTDHTEDEFQLFRVAADHTVSRHHSPRKLTTSKGLTFELVTGIPSSLVTTAEVWDGRLTDVGIAVVDEAELGAAFSPVVTLDYSLVDNPRTETIPPDRVQGRNPSWLSSLRLTYSIRLVES